MEILADIVMLLWIPCVVALFATLPAHRAVLAAFLIGWLFLPLITYQLPVLPDYSKMTATCIGALIGALVFDRGAFRRLRWRWFDLPVIAFCICPALSSATNQLGIWDALSGVLYQTITWGVPYLLSRAYFTNIESLRELSIGIFIGGLVYVPFCLIEMRIGPQLSNLIYGTEGKWTNAVRFGGYRPRVFMQDGLMLSMWMAICSLIGIWMWWADGLKRLFSYQLSWLVFALTATTILCRSAGAIALLTIGLSALWFSQVTKSRLALVGLLVLAPLYLVVRISRLWDGRQVTELASLIDADRASSFQFRLNNEDMLIAKALQHPIFGWGGWGRARIYDEWGNDLSVTDGLWIIELGNHGLFGLTALYMALLIPLWLLLTKLPPRTIARRESAIPVALSVGVVIYAIDCIPNGMVNPVFMLAAGAVTGLFGSIESIAELGASPRSLRHRVQARTAAAPLRQLSPGHS